MKKGVLTIGSTVAIVSSGIYDYGRSNPNQENILVWQQTNIFYNLGAGKYKWAVKRRVDGVIIKTGYILISEIEAENRKLSETFYFSDNADALQNIGYTFDVDNKMISINSDHILFEYIYDHNFLCSLNGISIRATKNQNDKYFDDVILEKNRIKFNRAELLQENNIFILTIF